VKLNGKDLNLDRWTERGSETALATMHLPDLPISVLKRSLISRAYGRPEGDDLISFVLLRCILLSVIFKGYITLQYLFNFGLFNVHFVESYVAHYAAYLQFYWPSLELFCGGSGHVAIFMTIYPNKEKYD